MLNKVGKYLGYVALWLVLWIIVSWAANSLDRHRTEQKITSFDITVEASNGGVMLDEKSITKWVSEHDINPLDLSINAVDLGKLEHVMTSHHAVANANAYITYDGSVRLNVEQRSPRARLRVDDYDMYVMGDGYIFPANDVYPAYVPVITGDYRPIFKNDFAGYVEHFIADSIVRIEQLINNLEQQKIPYHNLRQRYDAELRKVTNQSVRRGMFMSGYEYDRRCEELKLQKEQARRSNIAQNKQIDEAIAMLEEQQQNERQKQKKLLKIADDFAKLSNFVEIVADDDFWGAEIVQIILSEGYDGAMQIAAIPRSGEFTIDFGYSDALDRKLQDLALFYEQGLRNIGWNKYREVSLRYDDQIVCK